MKEVLINNRIIKQSDILDAKDTAFHFVGIATGKKVVHQTEITPFLEQ